MRNSRHQWLLSRVVATVALCAVGVGVSSRLANAQGGQPSLIQTTAIRLRAAGVYDFAGRYVECRPDQQVGIFAEGAGNIVVQNVVIRRCPVGILAAGGALKVSHADVSDAEVCMLVTGRDNTIFQNTSQSCSYGIVIAGDNNTISGNEFNDNSADGMLVTGHGNLITENKILRNAGIGIHLVRTVPMIGDNSFVPLIQNFSSGNIIRANTLGDNAVDLVEFGECILGLRNQWTENRFKSSSPDCIN